MDLNFSRGDIVICALKGDYEKPRPAVVVQADLFNTYKSLTLCLITSDLVDVSTLRVSIEPAQSNGLRKRSQMMVDKLMTVPREKIHQKIGTINAVQKQSLN